MPEFVAAETPEQAKSRALPAIAADCNASKTIDALNGRKFTRMEMGHPHLDPEKFFKYFSSEMEKQFGKPKVPYRPPGYVDALKKGKAETGGKA